MSVTTSVTSVTKGKPSEPVLQFSDDLALPLHLVTESVAILARKRAGKSYAAKRLVEQLHAAGQQVVVVDPKGDWWGLKSSRDGRGPGIPIVVLGGEHGDVPLDVGSGEVVARLVVERAASVVVDLSELRKHEVATFVAALLETIYRLKAREEYRTPLMVVIDEADAVAPQGGGKGAGGGGNQERMLGAAQDLVRRGGQRGIGSMFITQRAAVLNKSVLTQASVLVVLQTTGSQDLDAVKDWVGHHGERTRADQLVADVASLPRGHAWVWAPGWPDEAGTFRRVKVAACETFDSGATPRPGERRATPRKVAKVDLEAFRQAMAATVERAREDSPKELRRRVAELEAELKAERRKKTRQVAVSAFSAEDFRRVEATLRSAREASGELERANGLVVEAATRAGDLLVGAATAARSSSTHLSEYLRSLTDVVERAQRTSLEAAEGMTGTEVQSSEPREGRARAGGAAVKVRAETKTARRARPASGTSDEARRVDGSSNGKFKRGARTMLAVLATFDPRPMTRTEVAVFALLTQSGTFRDYVSALHSAGYVDKVGDDSLALTEKGRRGRGDDRVPTSTGYLLEGWGRVLKAGARRMLDVLVEAGEGNAVSRQYLGERAQIDETSGTFRDYVSVLYRRGLAEKVGNDLRPGSALFLGRSLS